AGWAERMRKRGSPGVKKTGPSRPTAALEMTEADKTMRAVPLKHDPPRIVFTTTPSILVYVDGPPSYQPVKETKLERVINTRVLLLREKDQHYLHVFDGWLEAPSLDGPWEVEKKPSKDLEKALAD